LFRTLLTGIGSEVRYLARIGISSKEVGPSLVSWGNFNSFLFEKNEIKFERG